MKWKIIIVPVLMLVQAGCACTRMVDRMGETRINVSQPRCVHMMSDGSMVAEASLRHERARGNVLVREDPRYFVVSTATVTTELARANSRGEVSIALTRKNSTMHPNTLSRCAPELSFPVEGTITST
jgi:hypothetical protein